MDMLSGERITAAALADWRKLGQGLHARFVIRDFRAGVRFLSAIGEAGEPAGHHPEVRMGTAYVDLKLISDELPPSSWRSTPRTPVLLHRCGRLC